MFQKMYFVSIHSNFLMAVNKEKIFCDLDGVVTIYRGNWTMLTSQTFPLWWSQFT